MAGLSNASCGLRFLRQHAAGDLHDGDQLQRLDAADPLEPAEIGLGPGNEPGQRTCLDDQALGDGQNVHAAAAAAEEHGQQFGVAQRGGPESLQAFLRAFGDCEVLDAQGRVMVAHGPGGFARRPAGVTVASEVLHVAVAAELFEPAFLASLALCWTSMRSIWSRTSSIGQDAGVLALLGIEQETAFGHDDRIGVLALFERKKTSLNSLRRSDRRCQPQSPPLVRRESLLYSFARSSNFVPAFSWVEDVVGLGAAASRRCRRRRG